MAWLKMFTLFLLMPGIVDVLVPWLILSRAGRLAFTGLGVLQIVGLVLALAGLGLIVWVGQAFIRGGNGTPAPFDTPRRFVSEGLYRWVRNPMYLGVAILIPFGEAFFFASAWLLPYMAVVILLLHLYIVYSEEPALIKRFGRPYKKYLRTVPRWLPRPPRD